MVDLVASLLQGSMEGLPAELILVNLQAGRATSAAICRRCCLGKVSTGVCGEQHGRSGCRGAGRSQVF